LGVVSCLGFLSLLDEALVHVSQTCAHALLHISSTTDIADFNQFMHCSKVINQATAAQTAAFSLSV
jgi:hypothetical protein